MDFLFSHHRLIRRNLIALIGFSLFLYFAYHIFQGNRSYFRLIALRETQQQLIEQQKILIAEKAAWEAKVTKMRPNSIDPDLAEEQIRSVLGYHKPNEYRLFGID